MSRQLIQTLIEAAVRVAVSSVGLFHILTYLRDYVLEVGWFNEDSWGLLGWLARNAKAAHIARVRRALQEAGIEGDSSVRGIVREVLSEIGITSIQRTEMQRTNDVLNAPQHSGTSPISHRLLRILKDRSKVLPFPFVYKDGPFYIDSMGATSPLPDREAPLGELLLEWVMLLEAKHVIDPFKCILCIKDGNVSLALQFSAYTRKALFLCKGQGDPARVMRPDSRAHETDCEGLEAFMRLSDRLPLAPDDYFNVIAIDDNCRGGSTIALAMQSFNELIVQKQLPFHKVRHAIVLFNIKSAHTDANFREREFQLYSILSFDNQGLKRLCDARSEDELKSLIADIASFKHGNSCEWSRTLNC